MRSVRLTVIAIATLAMSTAVGLADADGPDLLRVTGIAPGKTLNLRTGPGTSHPAIAGIPAGTDALVNLGCQGGLSFAQWQAASDLERKSSMRRRWCKVRFGKLEGWAAGRFLSEASQAQQPLASETGKVAAETGGTAWRLVGSPAGPTVGEARLEVAPNGDLKGYSGCNRFFATASAGSGSFRLTSPIGSTRMLCPEKGLSDQEEKLFSALERAAKYDFNIRTGTLWIMDDTDETLLELQLD